MSQCADMSNTSCKGSTPYKESLYNWTVKMYRDFFPLTLDFVCKIYLKLFFLLSVYESNNCPGRLSAFIAWHLGFNVIIAKRLFSVYATYFVQKTSSKQTKTALMKHTCALTPEAVALIALKVASIFRCHWFMALVLWGANYHHL